MLRAVIDSDGQSCVEVIGDRVVVALFSKLVPRVATHVDWSWVEFRVSWSWVEPEGRGVVVVLFFKGVFRALAV